MEGKVGIRQNIRAILLNLDEVSDIKQYEQVRLGAVCLGVPRGLVEKAGCLHDVQTLLDDQAHLEGHGLEFLFALLKVIGVAAKEIAELQKHISDYDLKLCEQYVEFKFAKLIILLCNDMTENDFQKFFNLCCGYFDHTIRLERYPTIEKFFYKLIEEEVICPGNVENLEAMFDHDGMGKIVCLTYVDEYKRAIGLLHQPSSGQVKLPKPGTPQ